MLKNKTVKTVLINLICTVVSFSVVFLLSALLITKMQINIGNFKFIGLGASLICCVVISVITVKSYGSKGIIVGALSSVIPIIILIIARIALKGEFDAFFAISVIACAVISAFAGVITTNSSGKKKIKLHRKPKYK